MQALEFVVQKEKGDVDHPSTSVHLWRPGEELSAPVWNASENGPLPVIPHKPTSFLRDSRKLYIGTNTGYVEQVDLKTGKVERYGPRARLKERDDHRLLEIGPLVLWYETLFDASCSGLFKTISGEQVDDRMIASAEVVNDRLLIVPHGPHPKEAEGLNHSERFALMFKSPAGDLIDFADGSVVMKRVHPFDGSGYAPGKHTVFNGKVYMHHGDYPDERITIRKLPGGEVVKDFNILTTGEFFTHDGAVYDLRCDRSGSGDDRTFVTRSDCDEEEGGVLYKVPSRLHVSGVVSAGESGVLMSLYEHKKDRTKIVSHLHPQKPMLEAKGLLRLIQA